MTTALVSQIPSIKAAMFAELPAGSHLGKHRDPYAGSVRYHLGLVTPNDDRCFIEVDRQRHSWRDGQAVIFDETYVHWAQNESEQTRIILFCEALLNKWILCCGTMKTVVSDNIKSMHYMLAYDGVLSGISVFYQNSADKTE